MYSYQQLLDLVTRATKDSDFYQQIYGKVYAVQLQQVGSHLHFNIVKNKKQAKESKKKGEKVRVVSIGNLSSKLPNW